MAAKGILIWLGVMITFPLYAQEELHRETLNNMELQAEAGNESEDDAWWQQLQAYISRPLDLNSADEEALQALGLLSPLEITGFLQYRDSLGALLSIFELQAVPGFELPLIRRLLPYVRVGNEGQIALSDYWRKGEHSLLLRHSRVLGQQANYLGSADKIMFRYRYSFPRHASWGITAEKDAGEQFFNGAQRKGFDFYSAHLFLGRYKKIHALAIGDYVVNLGQGLIQWHSMALGKGAAVMHVKREGEVLRPYTSAGEHFFFRGAGITLKHKQVELTAFASLRKLDAGSDTTTSAISSLVTTGYHRTAIEISKMGNVRQLSAGANLKYRIAQGHAGMNIVMHRLQPPLEKQLEPYSQFSFMGKSIVNLSADYAKGWRNFHFFGEAAVDHHGQLAVLQGILAGISPKIDLSLVYRKFARAYQSLYTNAFAAGSKPANEQGFYTGISLKPNPRIEVSVYADIYMFPWLRYRVDAPSFGRDALLLLLWRPSKQAETGVRFTYALQALNAKDDDKVMSYLHQWKKYNFRWFSDFKVNESVSMRTRLELNKQVEVLAKNHGWLAYQEFQAKVPGSRFRLAGRLTRFDVSGEGNGLYASENGMLYDYAMSRFSGRGWQYYLNLQYRLTKSVNCWLRFHRTEKEMDVGEELSGNKLLVQWQLIAKW
ncbi:hypothetical protein [uncultured Chitinophaga sp.]|uniref:ComEA family DNA-binding protein n=1 Tax=uncultured Chitinophaga sp. TaxID=339340 RepID=UPI0025EB2B5B|nr:hypothetical protein [uncultured Chitinophaga sp.]